MSAATSQQAKITLYWLNKSRSQRILWLLEELKVDYELKVYQRRKDMLAPPELKQVHPLGKSPVIGIQAPAATEPIIIAESGAIVEYLTDHFGQWLIPKRYSEGKEDQVGGESEEWLRYRFFMHYAEGSLMTLMLVALLLGSIKNGPVPFFLKPVVNAIVGRTESFYLHPNFDTHLSFLESQISTAPDNGEYLCGKRLTGADILMIYPLEAAQARAGLTKEKYPNLSAYIERIHERPAYQQAVQKVVDATGEPYSMVLGKL